MGHTRGKYHSLNNIIYNVCNKILIYNITWENFFFNLSNEIRPVLVTHIFCKSL